MDLEEAVRRARDRAALLETTGRYAMSVARNPRARRTGEQSTIDAVALRTLIAAVEPAIGD